MANHYAFSVGGQSFSGVSYSSEQHVTPGEQVVVEYRESEPAKSRVAGMRRQIFGPGVAWWRSFR